MPATAHWLYMFIQEDPICWVSLDGKPFSCFGVNAINRGSKGATIETNHKTGMALQVEATDIFYPPKFFLLLFRCFAFDQGQCHYWWHEEIPGPYRGCTGSPSPPGWHINTCHCPKVCCISQHSLKSMKEIPGDKQSL
ncbi:hypothetical protein ILYODFUR_023353 [Ilyodon furcidens]|uniref:Uncharacterized protein n=1 Tax=Ilyodon furcidens TaxID=33524 RepID=A0ABV0V7M8_9TELE